jgi:hypothetical protein
MTRARGTSKAMVTPIFVLGANESRHYFTVWGMLLRQCQIRNFKQLSALSLCRCGIDAPPILRSNGRNLN